MPYCTVCKDYAEYDYDINLTNGNHLHTSCLIKLQIREDEIETILRQQNSQLISSIFLRDDTSDRIVISEEEANSLSSELTRLKAVLSSIYDFLPSWPPDWYERKQHLLQQKGSICSSCGEERKVYMVHDIPLCEDGTNQSNNLYLICSLCYEGQYGKGDVFVDFELPPSQSEFAPQVEDIMFAIDNNQKIQFDYKKANAKTWMTRVVVPEQLLNIPNSRDSGQTLCVEGFCELRQDTRVFALERMRDLEIISD